MSFTFYGLHSLSLRLRSLSKWFIDRSNCFVVHEGDSIRKFSLQLQMTKKSQGPKVVSTLSFVLLFSHSGNPITSTKVFNN